MKKVILWICLVSTSFLLEAQNNIKLDLIRPIYAAAEGHVGFSLFYEGAIDSKNSLSIGIGVNRFIHEKANVNQSLLLEPGGYERSLWGVSLIPEYRYYFKEQKENESGGFFLSAYGKLIFSKVYTTDFTTNKEDVEKGNSLGVGIGTGYRFRVGDAFTIEPFLGLGKGYSTHEAIFNPGGLDLDFIGPDLLIHRLEILVGYAF